MKRLPYKVDLGEYTVKVVLLTKTRMREVDEEWVAGDPTPEGLWDTDADTVYIGKWLTMQRKWHVFYHELTHALIDFREQGSHETLD